MAGRHWVPRLLGDCTRHPALTAAVLASAVLATLLAAVVPLASQIAVDGAIRGDTGGLVPLSGVLLGVALLQFVGSACRQYLAGRLALTVQHDLRTAVFDAVAAMDGPDTPRTGQVMSRATIDLQLVHGLLTVVPQAVGGLVVIVFSVAAMVWLSPLLALVAVAVLISFTVVTARAGRRIPPASLAVQRRTAQITQHVEETLVGSRVVSAFGQEDRETRRLADLAGRLFGERVRAARVQAAPGALLGVLPHLGQVAVLVLGAWSVSQGSVSLGALVAFSGYLITLTAPSAALSSLVMSAQMVGPAARRVYDLVDLRPSVAEPEHPEEVPEGPLGVEFDGVRFRPGAGREVLAGVDLRVRPGETLALVGPSGSGKSSLALLVPRFHDATGGAVRIGSPEVAVDVRSVGTGPLRAVVGVAFEEAFLFSRSIAENIAYGHPNATREQIRVAAREAGADEFVSALPDGYDTVVGDRGLTLSGGQRRRVALARALMGDPRILVLDDPTAAVDTVTEEGLVASLAGATAERTVLLVARGPAVLALADRIAVLDDGRVVDVGTREELLDRCPLFRESYSGREAGRVPRSQAPPRPDSNSEVAGASTTSGGGVDAEERTDTGEERAGLPPADERPPTRLDATEGAPPGPRWGPLRVLAPVRALVVAAILLVAAEAVATTVLPMILRRGLDEGAVAGDARAVALTGTAALVLVAVDWWVLRLQPVVIARTGEGALYALRLRLFRHLHRLGPDFHERERAGLTTTRMTTDVTALSTFVESGLTILVVNGATVLCMVVAMTVLDLSLTVVALAVLPILALVTLRFRHRVSTAYSRARDRIGEVNADLREQLAGSRQTAASGARERARRRFTDLSEGYRRARIRAQRHVSVYFPFITLLGDVSTAAVLIVGAHRVAEGTLTVGALTAFLLYLGMFYAPFQQMSVVFDGYQQARVGADRIGALLRVRPVVEVPVAPRPVESGPEASGGAAEVVVEGVRFTYPGARSSALDGIDLRIGPKETVALLGETGAGKSTLVRLLARFADPDHGRILVDEVDLRDLDPAEHRRRLGIVPQEPHLFVGTVADNVRYGRPEAADQEVEAAIRDVGERVLEGFVDGLGHRVGEGGEGLSAGQRRLLCLARAHLVAPRILLFDEPTAALDPAAEVEVLDSVERMARGRTALIVTHSPRVAARADRIIVLDGGQVVEDGTHRNLLAADGPYARLCGRTGQDVGV